MAGVIRSVKLVAEPPIALVVSLNGDFHRALVAQIPTQRLLHGGVAPTATQNRLLPLLQTSPPRQLEKTELLPGNREHRKKLGASEVDCRWESSLRSKVMLRPRKRPRT